MKRLPSETRQAMLGSSAGIMFSWFRIVRHLWSFCKSVECFDSCWLTVDLLRFFLVNLWIYNVSSVNSFVPVDILIQIHVLLSFFTKYVDRIRYADSLPMSFDPLLTTTKHQIDSNWTSKGLLTITNTNPQVSTYTTKRNIWQREHLWSLTAVLEPVAVAKVGRAFFASATFGLGKALSAEGVERRHGSWGVLKDMVCHGFHNIGIRDYNSTYHAIIYHIYICLILYLGIVHLLCFVLFRVDLVYDLWLMIDDDDHENPGEGGHWAVGLSNQ